MNKYTKILFTFIFCYSSALSDVPQLINYQGIVSSNGSLHEGLGQFKFAIIGEGQGPEGATATAGVSFGFLTNIQVAQGGSGYITRPDVIITDPTGVGAAAFANLNGDSVSSITVTNAGYGYSSSPIITISAPQSGNITTYWSNDGSSTLGSEPDSAVEVNVSEGIFSLLLGDINLSNMNPLPASVFTNENVSLRIWFSDLNNGFEQLTPDQRIAAVGYAMMSAQAAPGSIDSAALAQGAVTSINIAPGSIDSTALAQGAITSDNISTGAITSDKIAPGAITYENLDSSLLSGAGQIRGDLYLGPSVSSRNRRYDVVFDVPAESSSDPDLGSGVAVAYNNGKVYVLAGQTPGSIESIYVYDSATRSWSQGASMTFPREGASSVVHANKIYVFGGVDAYFDYHGGDEDHGHEHGGEDVDEEEVNYVRQVEVFDTETESWSIATEMPELSARRGLCSEVIDNIVYIMGGENSSGVSNRLDTYDIYSTIWSIAADLPVGVSYAGSIAHEGYIGIAGGQKEYGSLWAAGAYYDPQSGIWESFSAQAAESEGRLRPRLIAEEESSDEIFIVGGVNSSGQRSTAVDVFRPGRDLYAIPINTQGYEIYTGTIFDDDVYFWGDGLYAIDDPDYYGNNYEFDKKYGDSAYWRNRLNCTIELSLGANCSLALLDNPEDTDGPEIYYNQWDSVQYQYGMIPRHEGNITKWYMYNLPAGLSFNPITGEITGYPQQSSGDAEISVMGISVDGTASATFRMYWGEFWYGY